MLNERIIWQYWETKNFKPPFIDELYKIAIKNAGVKIIQVTPETIFDYLPNLPKEILDIDEIAHKADMIRTMLVYKYGGMWLDSDAVVLSDLNWLFDMLENYDFVGFNAEGNVNIEPLNVSINCFLAPKESEVIGAWIKNQHEKLHKKCFAWTEVGTDILDPILSKNKNKIKILDFSMICPVKWNEVKKFSSWWIDSSSIIENSKIVMLSNKALHRKNKKLTTMGISTLLNKDMLISDIINKAIDRNFKPRSKLEKFLRKIRLVK